MEDLAPTPTAALTEKIAKMISSLSLPLVIMITVEAALGLVAAIWRVWWRLPRRQLRRRDTQIHDPKARADTEDNFRKTVGQALGSAAVLIGAVAAYLQSSAIRRCKASRAAQIALFQSPGRD